MINYPTCSGIYLSGITILFGVPKSWSIVLSLYFNSLWLKVDLTTSGALILGLSARSMSRSSLALPIPCATSQKKPSYTCQSYTFHARVHTTNNTKRRYTKRTWHDDKIGKIGISHKGKRTEERETNELGWRWKKKKKKREKQV